MDEIFKKFYEKGNEVDYETKKALKLEEVWPILDSIFSSLKNVNVVDVYIREVEIDKNTSYPTIIVDIYNKDGTNPVYLIYVEDLDYFLWRDIKNKIINKYRSQELNVCDEDETYVSFCS